MSGRICVAMCITMVPSAWNADAIAIRSRPERSSAQVKISRGCASSNLSFRDRSSSGWRRVCTGRPFGFGRAKEPGRSGAGSLPLKPFRMLGVPYPE